MQGNMCVFIWRFNVGLFCGFIKVSNVWEFLNLVYWIYVLWITLRLENLVEKCLKPSPIFKIWHFDHSFAISTIVFVFRVFFNFTESSISCIAKLFIYLFNHLSQFRRQIFHNSIFRQWLKLKKRDIMWIMRVLCTTKNHKPSQNMFMQHYIRTVITHVSVNLYQLACWVHVDVI